MIRVFTVFLDIDGVVHTYKEPGRDSLSPGCIKRLNELTKQAEVQVVLSSAWRLVHGAPKTLELLRKAGYTGPAFSGSTEHLDSREEEILAYITEHNLMPRDVLVLDDIPMRGPIAARQVLTNMQSGLTPKKLQKALALYADHLP